MYGDRTDDAKDRAEKESREVEAEGTTGWPRLGNDDVVAGNLANQLNEERETDPDDGAECRDHHTSAASFVELHII